VLNLTGFGFQNSNRGGFKVFDQLSEVRTYSFEMCDDCYNLLGDMCHNPECCFCRKTMVEVSRILDDTLVRPVVNGEQIFLNDGDKL